MNETRPWFRLSALFVGYAFLYIPIVSLVVYSFNKSRLVTVWGGFSTKWYGELMRNDQILNAAWLSLKVGALSATLAVVLGTIARNRVMPCFIGAPRRRPRCPARAGNT